MISSAELRDEIRTEIRLLKAENARLREAIGALGVIGGGYCFCSRDRNPNKSYHEPECADVLAALEAKP